MGGVMICLVVSCFLWSGELESPYLLLSHHVIPLASHTIIILISIYLSIYLSFAIQCVIDHPYAILYLGIVGASIMQGLYISLYLCLHRVSISRVYVYF